MLGLFNKIWLFQGAGRQTTDDGRQGAGRQTADDGRQGRQTPDGGRRTSGDWEPEAQVVGTG